MGVAFEVGSSSETCRRSSLNHERYRTSGRRYFYQGSHHPRARWLRPSKCIRCICHSCRPEHCRRQPLFPGFERHPHAPRKAGVFLPMLAFESAPEALREGGERHLDARDCLGGNRLLQLGSFPSVRHHSMNSLPERSTIAITSFLVKIPMLCRAPGFPEDLSVVNHSHHWESRTKMRCLRSMLRHTSHRQTKLVSLRVTALSSSDISNARNSLSHQEGSSALC